MGLRIAVLMTVAAWCAAARHLPIQVYTTAQGLPRNQVDCMTFSPTGILWVCTSEGLARFDGYHFRLFGPDQGLPSRRILDLVPSRHGGYWLVSSAGICRLASDAKTGQPCRLLESDRKPGQWYSDVVLEQENGSTWVAATTALYRMSGDERRLEPTTFETPPNQQILMVSEGLDGDLLVGTDFQLFAWKPGGKRRLISEAVGPVGCQQSLRVAPGEWLCAATNGLFRLRNSGAGYSMEKIEAVTRVNVVLRRRDGTIWIGGNGGVRRIEFGEARKPLVREVYTAADGLPSSEIVWLVEDAQGSLWGATEGNGIFRIAAGGFVTYGGKDGLGTDRIASIFDDEQKRVVVETSWGPNPDFRVWNGSSFHAIPFAHPPQVKYFGWGWNQLSLRAHDGEWWIPAGQSLLRYPKLGRFEEIQHTRPRLYGPEVTGCTDAFRLFEEAGGDLWLSCIAPNNTLIQWERATGQFRTLRASDGWLEGARALAIRQAPDGTLWVGSGSSAFRRRNGRFERLPLGTNQLPPSVKDLIVDHAGRLWVATDFEGLLRCDNPEEPHPVFRPYTTREGLSTMSVMTVQEDAAGFIYAGTAAGVDRIDPQAPIDSRRVRHFTPADGLPDALLTTSYRDGRGHLWFGSIHGLSELDPSRLPRHAPPPVYVMAIRVRGEDVPLPWDGAQSVSLDLAADRNQVEIEYAGIDLGSAGSLHYQYRLSGVDRDWSMPVDHLSVNYASLPSGPVRFEVRAVDADGQLSPRAAALDLAVAAPLWQRWWFIVTASLLIAAVTTKIYHYRVRSLLAVEKLRTHIATDLHDDIGASLTQISILSELARRNHSPGVLADIANIARSVAQDMSDIVWAVNPRHDRFEGLAHRMRRFAEDTLGGAGIEVAFEAEDLPADLTIPLDARRPLYLVFKEAVNNIARHSGARRAWIRLSLDRTWLKMTVQDDGRGFDADHPHAGEGVASISRRMRDLGGKAGWSSRPGGGTSFSAVLPLRARTALPELIAYFRRSRR